jgi:methylated-DNA-[protein]-cysteine S-methyltransferase
MSPATTRAETAAAEAVLPGVGRIVVIASAKGLRRVEFLADSSPRIATSGTGAAAGIRDRALAELTVYATDGAALSCPVDLDGLPPFQRTVLTALRRIGRGRTISYGELAERVGKPGAARAVGNACANNPVPLWVPCHRVLASGGKLGGFSGGLDTKRALLALEAG